MVKPLACRCVRPEKLFELDEANAAVPLLEALVARLQRGALELQDEMTKLAAERAARI